MRAPAKPRAMSPLMERVLSDIAEGRGAFYGCYGRSEHGGRTGTIAGLAKRGLLDGRGDLTEAGRLHIAQEQSK
ncbi:hypothetical protein ASC85_07880 [Pseudomonas sp. Root401]|nr:hypothetical protein ASC85_07880 [Pseudomonas sp. Root401]